MIYEIPLSSSNSYYSQTIDLDGFIYTVKLEYNQRIETWSFALIDATGTYLYRGLARPGIDIISKIKKQNMPKGRLFFLSLEPSEALPDRDNLGDRVTLFYDSEAVNA